MKKYFFILLLSAVLSGAEQYVERDATPENLIFGTPGQPELLINRRGFCLGYSSRTRQAVWVSYVLIAEQVNTPAKAKRSNRFAVDPAVKYRPVRPKDYSKTGYDKGHLAPAADMAYSVQTMKNSFYMTNISPQLPGCNRGIWKRLEEMVRKWAVQEQKLCIVSGPVFSAKENKLMGKEKIPVPVAFFKVILDLTPPRKAIGFIVPNQSTKKPIRAFAVSVDEVERVTGLDFFSELPDDEEKRVEADDDFRRWE